MISSEKTEPLNLGAATLEALFGTLGSLNFDHALLKLVADVSGADRCGAFILNGHRPVAVAIASSTNSSGTKRAVERYLNRYWQVDRIWSSRPEGSQCSFYRLGVQNVTNRAWRRDIFDDQCIIDRISVVQRRAGLTICINAFRNYDSGCFAQSDIERFAASGALLATIVARHADLACLNRDLGSRLLSKHEAITLIGSACPELTQREREVCGRIVSGMSSEAIALDLSLQPNSILTYRKRAYAKLNITSQAELFSMCLRVARRAVSM